MSDDKNQDSSNRLGKVAYLALSATALVFPIIATPGTVLSTTNARYAGPGCETSINYWQYWTNCPGYPIIKMDVKDIDPTWLHDRLRVGAAMEIMAIGSLILCLLVGLVSVVQGRTGPAVRIGAIALNVLASIFLLIGWGVATTLLQDWSYRWGFALLVVAFTIELLATITSALFL